MHGTYYILHGVALTHHIQDHNGSACHAFQAVDARMLEETGVCEAPLRYRSFLHPTLNRLLVTLHEYYLKRVCLRLVSFISLVMCG